MKQPTIATMALVALLVTTGVAMAAPGDGPNENASTNASTADDQTVELNENASAATDQTGEPDENASAAGSDASAANAQGPAEDLPDHIPDHVQVIHNLIREFLNGDFTSPAGKAIQNL